MRYVNIELKVTNDNLFDDGREGVEKFRIKVPDDTDMREYQYALEKHFDGLIEEEKDWLNSCGSCKHFKTFRGEAGSCLLHIVVKPLHDCDELKCICWEYNKPKVKDNEQNLEGKKEETQ